MTEEEAWLAYDKWEEERTSMHAEAFYFVRDTVALLPKRKCVLEIGSRNINGSVRGLFPGATYIGIDIAPGDDVDFVADASNTSFTVEDDIDTVVCCEVLEHTPYAETICRNAYTMLGENGVFILTAAGLGRKAHSAVHGGPLEPGEFYANVMMEDLQNWLSDFDAIDIDVDTDKGDIRAVALKAAK